MANYSTLKAAVADVVKTNGSQAITGANLQTVLLSIINSIGGGGYIFNGVATPSTDAGTPDQNVFYIGGAGTYANFGTSVVVPPTNIAVFKYNGTWNCEQLTVENGGVFDISAYNNNTTYADLAAALGTNGANVPESVRKGGMSVKFVQSSDNKYVQYRYTGTDVTGTPNPFLDTTNWQEDDAEKFLSEYIYSTPLSDVTIQCTQGVKIDSRTILYNGEELLAGTKVVICMPNISSYCSTVRIVGNSWELISFKVLQSKYYLCTLPQNTTSLGLSINANEVIASGSFKVTILTDGDVYNSVCDEGDIIDNRESIKSCETKLLYTNNVSWFNCSEQRPIATELSKWFEYIAVSEDTDLTGYSVLNWFIARQHLAVYKNYAAIKNIDNSKPDIVLIPEQTYNSKDAALNAVKNLSGTILSTSLCKLKYSNDIVGFVKQMDYTFEDFKLENKVKNNKIFISSNPVFNKYVKSIKLSRFALTVLDKLEFVVGNTQAVIDGVIVNVIDFRCNFHDAGWNHTLSVFEDIRFDNLNDLEEWLNKTVAGKQFALNALSIEFEDNIKYDFDNDKVSSITYNIHNDLIYEDEEIPFLSPFVIAQDEYDNKLRNNIYHQKIKEAIIEHSGLDFDINEEMSKITYPMLRSDIVVVNDNLSLFSSNDIDLEVFEDGVAGAAQRIFSLDMFWVENEEHPQGHWDFSCITDALDDRNAGNIIFYKKRRMIPKVFLTCSYPSPNETTYTHNSIERKIDFPTWIADIMEEDGGQWVSTSPAEQNNSYWLLDINVKRVRDALIDAIEAFGEWYNSATVNWGTENNPEIHYVKDLILYIEFAPLGTWGEGAFKPLTLTADTDELLAVWNAMLAAVPDKVIVSGGTGVGDFINEQEFFQKMHYLSNSRGYIGFNIEGLGTKNYSIIRGFMDKFKNGEWFVTGEGCGWYQSYNHWGGDAYMWTFGKYLKEFGIAYARINNWTIEDVKISPNTSGTKSNLPLKALTDIANKNARMLAFVGYRYVLTPLGCSWTSHTKFNIEFSITNIGSSKCWWDFYKTKIIITDGNSDEIVNADTNIDVTQAMARPSANLGLYSIGNVYDTRNNFVYTDNDDTDEFYMYIKVVDTEGIVKPLYFSNYGRKKGELEGCYLLVHYKKESSINEYIEYSNGFKMQIRRP